VNLFNIGVDGQYRLAAMLAAAFGARVALPSGLRQLAIIVVAMLVGAFWPASSASEVTRGVTRSISSIMLNAVAPASSPTCSTRSGWPCQRNNVNTKPIRRGAGGGISLISGADTKDVGLLFLAIGVGVGFPDPDLADSIRLRPARYGPVVVAAESSGVKRQRMVFTTMLISGRLPGWSGMPNLLGESHAVLAGLPGRAWVSPASPLPARTQQSHRHRVRFRCCGRSWTIVAHPGPQQHPQGDRADHPGRRVLSVVVTYELMRRLGWSASNARSARALARREPARRRRKGRPHDRWDPAAARRARRQVRPDRRIRSRR